MTRCNPAPRSYAEVRLFDFSRLVVRTFGQTPITAGEFAAEFVNELSVLCQQVARVDPIAIRALQNTRQAGDHPKGRVTLAIDQPRDGGRTYSSLTGEPGDPLKGELGMVGHHIGDAVDHLAKRIRMSCMVHAFIGAFQAERAQLPRNARNDCVLCKQIAARTRWGQDAERNAELNTLFGSKDAHAVSKTHPHIAWAPFRSSRATCMRIKSARNCGCGTVRTCPSYP